MSVTMHVYYALGSVWSRRGWPSIASGGSIAAPAPAPTPTVTVPGAATSVASSGSGTTATVQWAAPSSNGGSAVTGYVVGRNGTDASGAGPWSTTVGAATFNQSFTNLTAGTTYTLSVAAVNSAGTGPATTVTYTTAAAVTPPPPAPTSATYGPVSTASVPAAVSAGTLVGVPTDATFVTFPVADTAAYLSTWLRTLTANQIGVLPERSAPYLLDTTNGFTGSGSYDGLVRLTGRGIVGLGPGAVIRYGPSSFTAGQTGYVDPSGAPQAKAIETIIANSYFGNFSMIGRDMGGMPFHGIHYSGSNTTFERIYQRGAQRGFKNSPPGEVGGICGNANDGARIFNVEIDCRDEISGARVGSSPWMFNNQTNVTGRDCYLHHSVAGMPTCYKVTGANFTRVRSEYNGSGSSSSGLAGSCFNFEICSGTTVMTDCTYICNWHNNNPEPGAPATYNSGLHVSIGSATASMVMHIVNATHDAGPSGLLSFQLGSTYGGATDVQNLSDISVVTTAGAAVAYSQYGK